MWAVENWKSKTRIPTFPPPRLACGARKKAVYTKCLTRPPVGGLLLQLLFQCPVTAIRTRLCRAPNRAIVAISGGDRQPGTDKGTVSRAPGARGLHATCKEAPGRDGRGRIPQGVR